MTTASGADNTASNQPAAVPLAGLPSYDDVLAHSDIYVGFFITDVFAVRSVNQSSEFTLFMSLRNVAARRRFTLNLGRINVRQTYSVQ